MTSKSLIAAIMVALLAFTGVRASQPTPYTVEAPELGRRGTVALGTSYSDVALPKRLRLTATGPVETPRSIGVRFWYPAQAAGAELATYRHELKMADGSAHIVVERGIAGEGAAPASGKFPLVIISHGFGGWSEQLSRLGEHLASRGYVVVSIDHKDEAVTSVPSFLQSFGNVIVDRSLDQKQLLAKLTDRQFAKSVPALAAADLSSIALIGYSMGGYGALATAGGAYDATGKVFAMHPPESRALATSTDAVATAKIKALILIAPWGGQPDNRAWNQAGLAKMTKPTLLIAGDHDDVVNFNEGVRWLFDNLKNADRHLLVFREARHNVVGNPIDIGTAPSPEIIGYTREPVWRQDRLNQVNQHFVTAFLDDALKNDAAKRAYLDVPVPVASDGKWPTKFGELDRGAYAGEAQTEYWRGFQRRWATGLELHRKSAGQ
jgi:predicted dienelactone hydrolase